MLEPSPRRAPVLLVGCYELGHPPLGVATPLAFLRRAGIEADAVDAAVEPLDEARLAAARFVGISVPMHTALRLGIEVARRVRAVNEKAHLCFYGLYAYLNAEHLLASVADSVLAGEIEPALLRRVRRVLDEGPARGKEADAPVELVLERVALPAPDRSAFAGLDRYARLVHRGEAALTASVEASRGCRHLCTHCPIPPVYGGRFFVVPADVVVEDVRRLVALGARHVRFADPDFLNGPGHALRVARAVHAAFPDLTFDVTAKVEHLLRHRALLPELRALGCLFIVTAVESLSDRVLAELDKGHTRQDVERVLDAVRRAGIHLRPTWVPFTPWTSLEDYVEMLDWIEARDLVGHVDPVQYAVRLLVPPGSLLARRPAMRPYLGPLRGEALGYPWTHPDPRMDALAEAVARRVERAAARDEPVEATFDAVRALALAAVGRPPAGRPLVHATAAPRMTEAWFC